MQRHGARDPGFHKILADYPRDCTMATSRGHCSSDNIRASVILKLRSRHASVRPSASARSTEANTIIVSCAIVYRRWLPKAFVSRCHPPRVHRRCQPLFPRFSRSRILTREYTKRILLLSRHFHISYLHLSLSNLANLLLLIDCRI